MPADADDAAFSRMRTSYNIHLYVYTYICIYIYIIIYIIRMLHKCLLFVYVRIRTNAVTSASAGNSLGRRDACRPRQGTVTNKQECPSAIHSQQRVVREKRV